MSTESDIRLRVRPETPYLVAALALLVLLAVALVPMVAISPFDHSFADDWHYGVDAHLALQAGGSVLDAVAAALAEVRDTFFSWQGTYSAIFLMALQPGVFSEAAYGWGAVAIIAVLIASTAYAASVLVRDILGADRATAVALTCLALLLQTQLLPSPVEGFWWYNAAIYYTFYHALMLLMLGLAVRLARGGTRAGAYTVRGRVVRAVLLALLAFVVAGGNFVTGLVAGLALAGVCVAALVRHRDRGMLIAPALIVFAAGFAVSMVAPGNAERQASQYAGDNIGVLLTLVRCGQAGFEYTVLWTNGYLLLALGLALPFMVRAARRTRCSFTHPGLACAASLALFMASFAPTLYAMGTVGPGRVQNIRYDLFVLLAFVCAQWAVGRAVRVLEARGVLAASDGARGETAGAAVPGALAGPDASGAAPLGPDASGAVPLGRHAAPAPGAHAAVAGTGRAEAHGVGAVYGTVAGEHARPALDTDSAPGASDALAADPADDSAPFCSPAAQLVYTVALLVLLVCSTVSLAFDERHQDDLTSVSAAVSLVSGEAAAYDAQVQERIALIEGSDGAEIEVPFYTVGPKVLFMGDIRDNMDNYMNYRLAQWYGKESILGYHPTA